MHARACAIMGSDCICKHLQAFAKSLNFLSYKYFNFKLEKPVKKICYYDDPFKW